MNAHNLAIMINAKWWFMDQWPGLRGVGYVGGNLAFA